MRAGGLGRELSEERALAPLRRHRSGVLSHERGHPVLRSCCAGPGVHDGVLCDVVSRREPLWEGYPGPAMIALCATQLFWAQGHSVDRYWPLLSIRRRGDQANQKRVVMQQCTHVCGGMPRWRGGGGGGGSDVLERPDTVGGGGQPPPGPHSSPQCLRLTAKISASDLRGFMLPNCWPALDGDHRETLGGVGSQVTPPSPLRTPPPPLLIHPLAGGGD